MSGLGWKQPFILNTLDTYPAHHPKEVKLLFKKKKKPPACAEGFGVSAVNTLGY
ncbi:hypothetical protein Ga0123461_1037 [Mariprofundus aestuarium]|uniref:Uncharacterized protein n=1 Tax=Mariprofundus aestuarium TaxID=1921086 RepID=A0A2K8L5F4_MARES|nr:hypothetical protein Ga0123461_1037 [Mariprofundus aestuarium]